MQPLPLNRASLGAMPKSLAIPAYDPAAVTPGIVHLGMGGFHRAHMARYTNDLMARDAAALRWGITGAGLMPGDRGLYEALARQDRLYTLVERSGDGEHGAVIGSIAGLVLADETSADLLDAIDGSGIRIVSLTVTEHGYCLDRATKRLDPCHPRIVHDLAHPRRPKSAIGIIVEGLRRRMAAGRRPFTAMSCDNIEHNGRVLRGALLDFAGRTDPALAEWIAAQGRFPGTMVDRITPVPRPENVADVAARYGVADACPVVCETFSQWVIEDDFADGRPQWEMVGAQFVADVAPYEFMKLRLLNASHLAIAGLGTLIGYTHVDEAMRDPHLRTYMAALMDRETGPTLLPVPGIDLSKYKATLIERFANPRIRDTLARINADAPLNYLLDPIRDRLARGAPVDLLALAVAAWLRRVRGEDERGQRIEIRHPLGDLLRERAIEGGPDPRPLLGIEPLFGALGRDVAFVAATERHLASLYARGSAATLAALASI